LARHATRVEGSRKHTELHTLIAINSWLPRGCNTSLGTIQARGGSQGREPGEAA